jgi:hypothetical protein
MDDHSERYLWDRSGPGDDGIKRLERLLRPMGHRPRRAVWAAYLLPIAAAVAAAVFLVRQPVPAGGWRLMESGGGEPLRAGTRIEPRQAAARLESEFVGRLDVEAGSRLQLLESGGPERFRLERGVLHAFIWAPPARFVVETPSAVAVDLGCQYTLRVEPDGSGRVDVQLGWVAFDRDGLESFVPAGATCRTNPSTGPGVPYYADASAEFRQAVDAFEFDQVLRLARPKDALTLWHLMQRTAGEDRRVVFRSFRDRVQLPARVTEEAIVRGERRAFDQAWASLGLGPTSWWRMWKRSF